MLYDLSSSYLEGRKCPLDALGYSRDGVKGKLQVNYGLICSPQGRPVSVSVHPGSAQDQTTVPDAISSVRERFGIDRVVFVGDRGMITQAHATSMVKQGVDFISALKAPLKVNERAFRTMKDSLEIRPIYNHLEDRVRAHIFLCMLAYYVSYELTQRLASRLLTDDTPISNTDPVAPARRSPQGHANASAQRTSCGHRAHTSPTCSPTSPRSAATPCTSTTARPSRA